MRQKRKLYGLRIGRAQQKGAGYDKRGLPSVSDQQLVRASWYGHLRHLTPKRGKGASGTQGHDFFDSAGGFAGGLGGASASSSVKASSDAKRESATNPSLEFSRAPVLSFARGEELVRAVASYDRV